MSIGNMNLSMVGKGLSAFANDLLKEEQKALDVMAVMLKQAIVKELRTPGVGRYYAKSRDTGSGVIGPKTKAQFRNVTINKANNLLARSLNSGKSSFDSLSLGKKRSLHRASKPGDPPAADTGFLLRSVFIEREGTKRRIGAQAAAALWLEQGTARVAPRPYLRPALEKVRARLGLMFAAVLGGGKA